jgi:hypothetical protein
MRVSYYLTTQAESTGLRPCPSMLRGLLTHV